MKEKKPLVSIIMNCLNGEEFLKFSIKSVIEQNYKNWELIFWDNKSTDSSLKILKSFKDKRIRCFCSKKRTVLYDARNQALRRAKGKFIAFLDVDDFWVKDKLSKQIPKFKNKQVGLVYSNFYKYYDLNRKKEIAFKNKLPKGNVTKYIIKNYQIGILTVILRKSFLIKKNVFDFKYDLLSDYDFILNFSLKHNFDCIDKPLAFYRIHNNQLQKRKMISQAAQFCNWFKKENIKKKFKKYDLSTINKKYDYYNLVKELDKPKINLFLKMFRKFNLINFLKINALIFLPKQIIFKFINNV
jgi:glycosyltransferase involved in cell wall biosynthesis